MKKTMFVFTPVFLTFIILFSAVTPAVAMSEDISKNVFRLHILANSNENFDQELKYKVRDKVLQLSKELYNACTCVEDAVTIANNNKALFKETAQKVIAYYGYDYEAKVYVTKEYFNTREYEYFTLPAGIYNSLKIVIGEGKGKNWWCVMFPSVCISGCVDDFDNVLTEDEKEFLTSGGYRIKFKTVEIIERIKSKIN